MTVAGAALFVLEQVAEGFVAPVGLVPADDGPGRLFILERAGRIRIL